MRIKPESYQPKNLDNLREKDDIGDDNGGIDPTDTLSTYLAEARQYPRLTQDEINKLTVLANSGDKEAFKRLISANLLLVVFVATKFQYRGLPLLDLIQEGNLGLMEAIKKFNPNLGFRFSTYAVYQIKQSIQRAINNKNALIRKPDHVAEQITKMYGIIGRLSAELGRSPTAEELAKKLKMKKEKVLKLLEWSQTPVSLSQPVGDDGSFLGDFLAGEEQFETEMLENITRQQLLFLLEEILSPKEFIVLTLYCGFHERRGSLNFQEIGILMDYSRERIRQLHAQAIAKVKADPKLTQLLRELALEIGCG